VCIRSEKEFREFVQDQADERCSGECSYSRVLHDVILLISGLLNRSGLGTYNNSTRHTYIPSLFLPQEWVRDVEDENVD